MQESINNSLSRQKSFNSDLLNLREEFDQFRITLKSKIFNSFNETISTKSSPKTFTNFPKKLYFKTKHNNLLINKNVDKDKNYNIKFKIEENFPKTPNIIDYKKINEINEKNLYKTSIDSIKKLNKSKTQINFFSSDNSLKNIKNIFSGLKNIQNIQNISKTSYDNKFIKKKIDKINILSKNKSSTIYFNTSLDDFYIKNRNKNNGFSTISPLNKLYKTKFSFYSPKSYSVNFINNIMNLYNKVNESKINKNKEKENEIHKKEKNEIGQKDNEENDKNIYNSLGKDTFNHISLKNLFQKNSAKIKNGVLDDNIINKKNNNDIFLNPFSNSYGILLDLMSEKVGFMKGSMDIIYPKITQKRYQLRTMEIKKKKIKKSSSAKNIKNQNNEINNIFNIKQKNFFQSNFSKYPINVKQFGQNILPVKMYSLKGKRDLINKIQVKASNP